MHVRRALLSSAAYAAPNEATGTAGTDAAEDDASLTEKIEELDRNEELLGSSKRLDDDVLKLMEDVEKGFQDQEGRSDDQADYWDAFECKLTSKQSYSGNSKVFLPIIHDAVNARKTRFTNQIFPISGRHVEVTVGQNERPSAITALLEHYIRKDNFRTNVMPSLCVNGDIEGQYNVFVSWIKTERHVVYKVKKPIEVEEDVSDDAEEYDDIVEETVSHARPHVEVLHDSDVCVLPHTADSVGDALARGGSATILRRYTKATIKAMMKDGEIDKDAGNALVREMNKSDAGSKTDTAKDRVEAAGIKGSGSGKFALVYETYSRLKIKRDMRLCRVLYAGKNRILTVKRNPNWSDKVYLFSVPVEKVSGAFKGKSKIGFSVDVQYAANDIVNEGFDSAQYSLLPIIMTDPEKNPRVGTMILNMAAIWETNPNDTKFASFPQLWKDAFTMVAECKATIFQNLSVTPAMMPQSSSGKKKLNQAEIANEQQVDLVATADVVTVIENGILTPVLQACLELDHQHRDEDVTVQQFGEMGERAKLEKIPPVQFDRRYEFRWFGVEAARNAQQIQQGIAAVNVVRGIPPDQLNGHKINMVPVITQLMENAFGPRLAPLIFVSPEQQMPVPVEEENAMLAQGFEVPTHEMDPDDLHIQAHMQALQMGDGGNKKKFLAHIYAHIQQKQKKQQAQMQAQQGQQGMPGAAGPGVAGTPRPGAQPQAPRGGQNPPGAIHADQMNDPAAAPRR